MLRRRSFVRIQSTACEQQRFEAILQDLDSNLLLHLALGHWCAAGNLLTLCTPPTTLLIC